MTNLNDNNNKPLSNLKIQEVVLRVMREYEEVAITDTKNSTADTCSLASSSHRENPNAIFTSEKLEKSDEIFDAVRNVKKNNVGCELNTAIASAAQGYIMSDPDTVTHTRNRILDQ